MAVHLDACIRCKRCVRRAARSGERASSATRSAAGTRDRVRPGRPDGRFDVRGVRRVRPACPTGATHAGARRRESVPERRRIPCVRMARRMSTHVHVRTTGSLYVQGRDGRPTRRLCVKGRYGFRLRPASAALTKRSSARPARRSKTRPSPSIPRSGTRSSAKPRGTRHLISRQGPARHPRHLRQARARRVRFGKRNQRGGVPVSEAGAHRIRVQQRGPLHAPLSRVERRRAHGRHQLRRGVEPGA